MLKSLNEFRRFSGNHEDFIAYNRAFHSALAHASGNRRMAAALCDLIGQADRLVRVSVANLKGHDPAQLVAEHVALIEAMQRRDGANRRPPHQGAYRANRKTRAAGAQAQRRHRRRERTHEHLRKTRHHRSRDPRQFRRRPRGRGRRRRDARCPQSRHRRRDRADSEFDRRRYRPRHEKRARSLRRQGLGRHGHARPGAAGQPPRRRLRGQSRLRCIGWRRSTTAARSTRPARSCRGCRISSATSPASRWRAAIPSSRSKART